jgi:F0F1-type ATP synthase gamma subunit
MKNLSETIKNEIKELTSSNLHTEARLLISKELMLVDLYREYNEIQISQELTGELLSEYSERRNAADKFLFSIANQYKDLF